VPRKGDLERADAGAVQEVLRELDEARERAGLTKETLAFKAGLPAASVRKLFTSRTANPALKTLNRLARPLGLHVRLVRTTPPHPTADPPESVGATTTEKR
jgi:transcriptional regulator with XRE-family HTH domain